MKVINELAHKGLAVGVAVAQGVVVQAGSAELREKIKELIEERKTMDFPPAPLKAAVRNLLRSEHFKPSGRSKPASEYLALAAKEGNFPFINDLVDVNNYVSLLSGLPISLLDLAIVGGDLLLRHGRDSEKYVFNEGGQEIDLHGLLCACRSEGAESRPLGNPVKDSLAAKIKPQTSAVVGIIYAPAAFIDKHSLSQTLSTFSELLGVYGKTDGLQTILA